MTTFSSALARGRLRLIRRHLLVSTSVWLLSTLMPAAADAAVSTLTVTEAQHHAVLRSRELSAQDAALRATRERGVAAGRFPDPVLKLGLDSWPINGADRFSFTADDFTMARIAVSQEWTGAEKRALRTQRFERASEITRAMQAALIAVIQRETAIAWFDRYYAEAMATLLAAQRKQLELLLAAAEADYRGGRGTQADLLAAHSALVDLDDRASEVDRRLRTAKINLERWVGNRAGQALADRPAMDSVRVDPSRLENQLAHHPAIAVLTRQQDLAWAEARLAQADRKADWSVELAYAQRGSFADFVSINLSIPLQWDQKNRQDREVAAKLAEAEQAGAARDEAVRAHVADVHAQFEAWETGRGRLARLERELIPLAEARTKAVVAAYRGGRASASEVLRARYDALDARLRAVELERDIARLWAQLNFLFPVDATARSGGLVGEIRPVNEAMQ